MERMMSVGEFVKGIYLAWWPEFLLHYHRENAGARSFTGSAVRLAGYPHEEDSLSQEISTSVVASWRTGVHPMPFGDPGKPLRVAVQYTNGWVRLLPATFRDRDHRESYLDRFHPDMVDKEQTQTAAPLQVATPP
jgi:hypothetical protein